MNETHSRHATATAFILFALLVSLRPMPAQCGIPPRTGWSPQSPRGPAAVWPTHIPRGDLAVRDFN
jgi:hypothetical protein